MEVTELVNRLVRDALRPVLWRCWQSGGQEMSATVSLARQ